ncbi:hypothetical protein LTR85_003852 [Meristemomyces frigidus]|nr:hypothetical protein LTR85_003852 [Meristemomyces frigidus]
MFSNQNSEMHVLIMGAGVAGLLIAHGLEQAGIQYTIFEAEDQSTFRPREWTMALHWGLPLIEQMLPVHLAARLREAYVDPSLDFDEYPNNGTRMFNGVTGELIKEMKLEGRFVRVSRRKLRALCSEGVDVKYGHSLEHLSTRGDEVVATFTNGGKSTGTMLVGADGGRSVVRNELFGQAKGAAAPLQTIHINIVFSYPTAEQARFVRSAHPVFSLAIGKAFFILVSIQDVPDPNRPETWRFQLIMSWPGVPDKQATNAERHKEVKAQGAQLAEPFKSAILWIPDGVDVAYQDIGIWEPERWDTQGGRVTLAGDAAHSMPPHRGQGLNHAIQDAFNFVEAAKRVQAGEIEQTESIQQYSDEVAERGAKEVRISKQSAFMSMHVDQVMESAFFKHGIARSIEEKKVIEAKA